MNTLTRYWRSPWSTFGTLSLCVLVIPALMVVGCGGGTEEKASTAEETSLEDRVLAQKEDAEKEKEKAEEAEAASYAADRYQEALAAWSEGEEAEDEGDEDSLKVALQKYRNAEKGFRRSASDAKNKKPLYEKVDALIVDFKKKLTEAKKANVEKLAPRDWKDANDNFTQGQSLREDGKPRSARTKIRNALRYLDAGIQLAGRKVEKKREATALKSSIEEARNKAVEAKADTLAASDMEYAKSQEAEGDKAFEDADFMTAVLRYQTAKETYAYALQTASQLALQQNANGGAEVATQQRPSGEAPKVEEIPIPDAADGSADIATGLINLFSVSPEYSNGIIKLEYASGIDFQKDSTIKLGGEYMHFEGSDWVGMGIEDYVLAGNTKGYILLDCEFEDGAQLEFDFQAQLVLADNPFFHVVLMSDGFKDYYASDFATDIQIYEEGRVPRKIPSAKREYRQHPNKWLQRREAVHMKVKYRKASEEEKGILEVWHDNELVCKTKTDKYRKGKVGFLWHNVKFYLKDLSVAGYLNEDWAKKAIERGSAKGEEGEEKDDFDF